jgi:hypothetical protein
MPPIFNKYATPEPTLSPIKVSRSPFRQQPRMNAQDPATAHPPTGTKKMTSNLIKVSLIAGALLLSACSGVSSHNTYSADSVPSAGFGPGPTNTSPNKMNFHGSALGNSFGEYSSGLLHDD